jgi:hypothetical protein
MVRCPSIRRFAALITAAALAGLAAAPAADAAYTAHSTTATVGCSGGSGFTVDANALFGQQTETNAWNAGDHGTTCGATLNP